MSDKRGRAFTNAIKQKDAELRDVRAAFAAYRADVEPLVEAVKTWAKSPLGDFAADEALADELDKYEACQEGERLP